MALTLEPVVDEADGLPVWAASEGEPLVAGYLAWDRLNVGHRCETWLAWCPERATPVAVKLARPHQLDHPRARAAVGREADWLAAVAHPGFPRLLADGQHEPVPHVVSEYVDGDLLGDMVEAERFEPNDAILLSLHLAASVRRLHALGVAHLDLKPDNVIVCEGRPVLVDLGSVRPLGWQAAPGSAMGSPAYTSPELEAGDPISPAMDLYGLGVVLLESVTGAAAFDADVAAVDRPDPAVVAKRLTGGLSDDARAVAALATTFLSPEPARRPPTLEGAMLALAAHLASPDDTPWPSWAAPSDGRRVGRQPPLP